MICDDTKFNYLVLKQAQNGTVWVIRSPLPFAFLFAQSPLHCRSRPLTRVDLARSGTRPS